MSKGRGDTGGGERGEKIDELAVYCVKLVAPPDLWPREPVALAIGGIGLFSALSRWPSYCVVEVAEHYLTCGQSFRR
jgi:hypothetical protein